MKVSEETRKKISESLKRAFSENRAHGWANTKQNKNGMSYPELWFEKFLKNENLDQNYVYNMQFWKYKLDFAWPDKRLCIEIDGNQHLYEDRAKSDREKDELLKEHGWKVLRLTWSFICANTQAAIQIIKEFLTKCGDVSIPLYVSKFEKHEERQKFYITHNTQKDISGRFNLRKLSEQDLLNRKNKILSTTVDLTKSGWVNKVSKETNMTRREIYNTVEHFSDLKEKVYRRM